MNKTLLVWGILMCLGRALYPAETGRPFMTLFPSKATGGHIQNWMMTQDDRGVIYVGNGYGIQEFDGATWRMILSPNQSFARTFAKDTDGRIYVGSSGMLGYLEADDQGLMQYRSLLEYIRPEDRIFSYVWTVQATPAGIYFQAKERLFRFRRIASQTDSQTATENWQVQVWRPRTGFSYTFWLDQTLYVQQPGAGLTKMVGDSLILLPGGEQFTGDRVQVMLPFPPKPGCYLLGTFNRGLFIWDGKTLQPFHTDSDSLLYDGPLYTGVISPDSCFALGTIARGFFIIDPQGRTKLHLTQASGLISNTVSGLFVDRQKNIWIAMDGGIAVLEYNAPLSQFDVAAGSGLGDFCRHQGTLYASANDGVYYLDRNDGQFKHVTGITGNSQAFYFLEINQDLFITTGSGIYRIQGTVARLALRIEVLSFQMICLCRSSQDPNLALSGTIDGVILLRYDVKNPNRFRVIGRVAGVHEYIRTIVESEPGVFWLSAMDAGTLRLKFDPHNPGHPIVERFGPEAGLPLGGVTVFRLENRMFFGTKQGLYQFDAEKKRFSRAPFFAQVGLGRNPDESTIVVDRTGNIWANLGRESVVFMKQPDGSYQLQKDQLARFADEPTNVIYPEADGIVWFGTANSAVRFAPQSLQVSQVAFPALIRRVAFANDSVIFHGAQTATRVMADPAEQIIPYRFNALRFDYAAPSYLNPVANEFRTQLAGFDATWSAWNHETRRNYTNLPAGKY
ncbi:hypothetical protein L0128_23105, partial [candidate division KSB1 bacterium]|nr:hypothetical protein [candidate division KSB1 bacterium]